MTEKIEITQRVDGPPRGLQRKEARAKARGGT